MKTPKFKPLKASPTERAFLEVLKSKSYLKTESEEQGKYIKAYDAFSRATEAIAQASVEWGRFVLRYFQARLKAPKFYVDMEGKQYIYNGMTVNPFVSVVIHWPEHSVTLRYIPKDVADFRVWATLQIGWIKGSPL